MKRMQWLVLILICVVMAELLWSPRARAVDGFRDVLGVDKVQGFDDSTSPPSYKLSGKGVRVAVWDPTGFKAHADFSGRVLRAPLEAAKYFHAKECAGVLGGSGKLSATLFPAFSPYRLRGVAPEVKIAFYLSSGEKKKDGTSFPFWDQYKDAVDNHKVDLASCSYGHKKGGEYTGYSAGIDGYVAGSQKGPRPIPFFFAAGNDGYDGYGSLMDVGACKNAIVIGSTNVPGGSLAEYSSLGPTKDGRVKPDLVAPGAYYGNVSTLAIDHIRLLGKGGATVKAWEFDAGAGGWTAKTDLTGLTVSGGALRATTTARNPVLHGPDKLGILASSVAKVQVRMSSTAGKVGYLQWTTNARGSTDETRRQHFGVTSDKTPRTYTLDLSAHAGWSGTIRRLVLRPVKFYAIITKDQGYDMSQGTSISAPAVAGVGALMLQAFRETHPGAAAPRSASYKAMLVATARDLKGSTVLEQGYKKISYGPGPDFATGHGAVDAAAAVALVRRDGTGARMLHEGKVTSAKDTHAFTIPVAANTPALKLALVWDDPPGTPGATAMLVNDLDLVLRAPKGKQHLPWVLDPASPKKDATRGTDRRNNVEVVEVASPAPGSWTATVSVHALTGSQRYSLALQGGQRLCQGAACKPLPADGGVAADGGAIADALPDGAGGTAEEDGCGSCSTSKPVGGMWLLLMLLLMLARRLMGGRARPAGPGTRS